MMSLLTFHGAKIIIGIYDDITLYWLHAILCHCRCIIKGTLTPILLYKGVKVYTEMSIIN